MKKRKNNQLYEIYKRYHYILDTYDNFKLDRESLCSSFNMLISLKENIKEITIPNITISEEGIFSLHWQINRYNLFTIESFASLSKCTLSYKPFLHSKEIIFFNFKSIDELFNNKNFSKILKIMKKSKL